MVVVVVTNRRSVRAGPLALWQEEVAIQMSLLQGGAQAEAAPLRSLLEQEKKGRVDQKMEKEIKKEVDKRIKERERLLKEVSKRNASLAPACLSVSPRGLTGA